MRICFLAPVMLFVLARATQAHADNGKCDPGWTSGERGICYRTSSVEAAYGVTTITGEIISPKAYAKTIFLGVALYAANGSLMCNGTSNLQGVEKNTATPFTGMCTGEHPSPAKVKVRITIAPSD